MNKVIQFVLILAVGLILYFLLNRMMQKLMVELSEILYKEVNPEKYLQVLNSWKGKMFFSRKTRSLMAIDALLMQNETANDQRPEFAGEKPGLDMPSAGTCLKRLL